MENTKLKIKVGEHEFEAEGPAEVVQAQFAAFKELVSIAPKKNTEPERHEAQETEKPAANNGSVVLDKIMRQDGRIVSLTARAGSLDEEILLVLLGQKVLRTNESVTGNEIMEGLKVTGHVVGRIDYKLDKLTEAGLIITIGTHRSRRYRLTNQGAIRAQEIAKAVIETVA